MLCFDCCGLLVCVLVGCLVDLWLVGFLLAWSCFYFFSCQVLSSFELLVRVFLSRLLSVFEVIYLSFVSVLHMTYFCFWRLRSHLPPDLGRSQHPVRTNSGHFTLNA